MILLLANYIDNIREKVNIDNIKEQFNTKEPSSNNNSGFSIILYYFLICLAAALLSFIINWQDNQPISVCLLCAIYAWSVGIFYFVYIALYYLWYYSKNNYYYVEFSKTFNTRNLKKINITDLENCIENLLPQT